MDVLVSSLSARARACTREAEYGNMTPDERDSGGADLLEISNAMVGL